MSVVRKYRLVCHTFQNFPGIFSVLNREFSTGGGDGNSGSNSPYANLDISRNKQAKKESVEVSNPNVYVGKLHDESDSSHNVRNNIGPGKYSTSNPIIPDPDFPLPGNIGFSQELITMLNNEQPSHVHNIKKSSSKVDYIQDSLGHSKEDIKSELYAFDSIAGPVEEQRMYTLEKLIKTLKVTSGNSASKSEISRVDFERLKEIVLNYGGPIEMCTFECPQFILKQLLPLFPEQSNLGKRGLFLINMSHKTVNDMSGWNEQTEQEREQLIEKFVHGAQLICEFFKVQNFFADFIDPATGKPFYSAHTNYSLFETDELYEKFGFRIDDLGCCKVIHHGTFGTHVFVGTILTDAPVTHKFLTG